MGASNERIGFAFSTAEAIEGAAAMQQLIALRNYGMMLVSGANLGNLGADIYNAYQNQSGAGSPGAPSTQPTASSTGTPCPTAESSIQQNAKIGKIGEQAAGISAPKIGIKSPLSGRMRFPDEVTKNLLKEVKNVARQGFTAQLKDYLAIARSKGLDFELWVRNGTILSKSLQEARDIGDIIIKFIPGL